MALLDIKKYPAKVLKQKAAPVAEIDEGLQRLIDDMIETMYAAPGVGLAAPQVGVSKRLAVIDISAKEESVPLLVLINPVILHTEGEIEFEEGCLSIPDYTAKVTRAESLVLRALDRSGRQVEVETGGLLSVAIQHELDHLDGILFIDRLSPVKREFIRKKFRKKQKSAD
ncbi:MAG: peptide deformylase [Nitrospiraceae bacterium]|nr:peptide deformylase [Nitrospiraceae bacterium]